MSPNMKIAWSALGVATFFNALQYIFPDRALVLLVPMALAVIVSAFAFWYEVRR